MKKTIMIGLILVLLVASGCANISDSAASSESIKLGYSGALTGELASLGENNIRGIQLAIEEINSKGGIDGRPLEIIYQDDQFIGKQTLTNYQKFVTFDDVDVILTTTYGGMLTTAQLADRDKVVVVNTVDASDEIAEAGEYSFAIGIYDEGIGYTMAEFIINDLKEHKTGVIYNKADPFVGLVKAAFIHKFVELGGTVEIEEAYDPSKRDFRTQLTKLKDANMESIVIIGFDEQGLLLKQARDLGIKSKFIGIDTMSSETVIQTAQGATEGVYFTFWEEKSEKLDDFINKYKTEYGKEPSQLLFAVTGYDSVMMVAKAMENGNVRGEALKDSLYSIQTYEGLAGKLSMNGDGIVRSIREKMFQIQEDKFVKIDD